MDFSGVFSGQRLRELAIWQHPRRVALAGGVAVCAAAAAVAAAPDSSGMEAHSVTTALPAPRALPGTLFAEPTSAAFELTATVQPGDDLKSLLTRSGVAGADAAEAAELIAATLPAGAPEGTQLNIILGKTVTKGQRQLERLSLQPGGAFKLLVGRTQAGDLKLARDAIAVDATPQRFRGRAGSDLFWSLRAAGVPAEAARDYLEAIATRTDLKQVASDDTFDLVVDHWRGSDGKAKSGPLLYAALQRATGRVQLVRWTVGNRTGWFDPTTAQQRVDGFEQPVKGRQTSSFGYRVHPILRFARFHDGIDYGAAWGSPVFAVADGVVSGSGWNGGYGRQVRLVHSGGVVTSYSHLSRNIVQPGMRVQRGQLIGLVGSSGFSTGSHLHFEVRRNGQPVDPRSFRQAGFERIGNGDLALLRARLEQLRSI